jgi:uncharacterized membrane protein
MSSKKSLQTMLILGGLIGLIFSGIITVEKMHILADPLYTPPCSINPLLSCGSVMQTPQASVFGFPNSLIGIAGFAIMICMGVTLLAQAQFKRWYWLAAQAGMTFAISFIYWLFYQSVYVIGALCLYCMAVWTVTIPMFLSLTLYNLRKEYLRLPEKYKWIGIFVEKYRWLVLALMYGIIILAIVIKYWAYWKTLIF